MPVRNKICTLLLFKIWLLNCIFSTNKILSMGHKMRSMLMLQFCTITQLIKKSNDNFIITTLYLVSLEIKAKSKSLWPVTLSIVVFWLWSRQIYHKLIMRFNPMHTGNSLRHLRTWQKYGLCSTHLIVTKAKDIVVDKANLLCFGTWSIWFQEFPTA